MLQRQPCTAPKCHAAALLYSEPARCLAHVASAEDWFEQLEKRLSTSKIPAIEREFEMSLARREFTALVYRDKIAGALYQAWYQRVEPDGNRRFSISDVASFCFLAATAGIIGNAAYDALKSLIRKLSRKGVKSFQSMIFRDTYEEIRARIHHGKPATLELDEDVSLLVRRRYWILVKTVNPKTKNRKPAT